jgi:hypothetical protein
MDFTTLKRRIETGAVLDIAALVSDLNLIFENATVYNGKGTDYYRMAQTLKDITRVQHTMYNRWRQEHGGSLGGVGVAAPAPPAPVRPAGPGVAAAAPAPAPMPEEPPPPEEDVEMGDADADAGAKAEPAVRRGGRRGSRG